MVHEKRIEVRVADVDAYRHVNNAVYATYLEECRDEWMVRALGSHRRHLGLRPRARRDRLPQRGDAGGRRGVVRCRLVRVGTSSLGLAEEIVKLDGTRGRRGRVGARHP